jgi:squalene synthase HpnC
MVGSLDEAYATCLRFARAHYENFPVASWLIPAAQRPHVAAIYAFARIADDIADEPGRAVEERLELLRLWRRRLHGHPPTAVGDATLAGVIDPVFAALHHTIDDLDLPLQPFDDLLSAFEQDVETHRYATWDDVLDYCRRSANPVGRLVLRVFGHRRADLDRPSDALCTALQLTNFWQDLAVDWSRGRLYVPAEIWERHGADPAGLSDRRLSTAWITALGDVIGRTRRLFDEGRPICDGVTGRLRYELRATWLGGARVLERLEHAGYDVLTRRPTLGTMDLLVIALRTATW